MKIIIAVHVFIKIIVNIGIKIVIIILKSKKEGDDMSFVLKEYVGFIPDDREVNKMACGGSKKCSSKKSSSKKTSSKKTSKGC